MKILITPQEVAILAFNDKQGALSGLVSEASILSAQRKFIAPVLGSLYDPVEDGKYPDLLEHYIQPSLAFYVKYLILPNISVRVGPGGIARYNNDNLKAADELTLSLLRKEARAEGRSLLQNAVDHIMENPGIYPEYDERDNVLNRIDILSGVVL